MKQATAARNLPRVFEQTVRDVGFGSDQAAVSKSHTLSVVTNGVTLANHFGPAGWSH